jgi:hypothetical protein
MENNGLPSMRPKADAQSQRTGAQAASQPLSPTVKGKMKMKCPARQ